MIIGTSGSRYSNAIAGDANDAEVLKISRSITSSSEVVREAMWKKISSPFAMYAIGKSMSVPILFGGSSRAGDERNDDR